MDGRRAVSLPLLFVEKGERIRSGREVC